MARTKSRPARWSDACAAASAAAESLRAALDELDGIRQEYEEWRDNLPENMESSTLAEKLDAVVDLDLLGSMDEIENTISEAEGIELPLGFGRD